MTAGTELVTTNEDAALDVVQQRVAEFTAQAQAVEIRNAAEANAATEILSRFAKQKKDAAAERKELVGPLNAHVKLINAKFKDAIAPLDAADQIVRSKVGTYTAEQERVRREEEAQLERERQERERKAREERERQEAEARAKREAAEKEAREAEELAKAEASAEMEALAEEAAQKLAEAQTAEAAVEALPEPELPKAVVPVAPALKSESGAIATRKVWKATILDNAAVPERFKVVDEVAIKQHMRDTLKATGKPPQVPGVKFEQVGELAVRAR